MPTFEQTFANCPFPEGVLAVLGDYPAQVRVVKARRAMEVAVTGTSVSRETLAQAEDCLKRTFGLNSAAITVKGPGKDNPAGADPAPADADEPPLAKRNREPAVEPGAVRTCAVASPCSGTCRRSGDTDGGDAAQTAALGCPSARKGK